MWLWRSWHDEEEEKEQLALPPVPRRSLPPSSQEEADWRIRYHNYVSELTLRFSQLVLDYVLTLDDLAKSLYHLEHPKCSKAVSLLRSLHGIGFIFTPTTSLLFP